MLISTPPGHLRLKEVINAGKTRSPHSSRAGATAASTSAMYVENAMGWKEGAEGWDPASRSPIYDPTARRLPQLRGLPSRRCKGNAPQKPCAPHHPREVREKVRARARVVRAVKVGGVVRAKVRVTHPHHGKARHGKVHRNPHGVNHVGSGRGARVADGIWSEARAKDEYRRGELRVGH